MEYRRLGPTGLQISALSLGAWVTFGDQVDDRTALALMRRAFEGGVNFFDNAEVYAEGRAEEVMGWCLKELGWRRSEYLVSTKIFWGGKGVNERGLSWKHIREGVAGALKRLGVEYVDLVFCHRPDLHTPIEETVRAMDWVIRQGWALYWGTSEWSAVQIREARAVADALGAPRPVVEQPQYHMFHRERVEREYLPLYEPPGLGLTTWSPLARGLLTGKYNEGIPPGSRLSLERYAWLREEVLSEEGRRRIAKVKALTPIARELGLSMAQLAIAWCLRSRHVSTVILGASRVEQLEENLAALDGVARLTPEVEGRIEAVLENRPSPPRDWREVN